MFQLATSTGSDPRTLGRPEGRAATADRGRLTTPTGRPPGRGGWHARRTAPSPRTTSGPDEESVDVEPPACRPARCRAGLGLPEDPPSHSIAARDGSHPTVAAPAPVPAVIAPPKPTGAPVDTLALPRSGPPGVRSSGARREAARRRRHRRRPGRGPPRPVRRRRGADALGLIARLARPSGQVTLAAEAYERLGRLDPEDAVPLVQAARMRLAGATPRPQRRWPARRWAAMRGTSRPGRRSGALSSARQPRRCHPQSRAGPDAGTLARMGAEQPRVRLPPGQPQPGRAGGARARRRASSPRPRWCRTTSASPASGTGDLDGARTSYARSALLAPRYVKARVNGSARRCSHRPDGGVDATHVPQEGDGEE